MDALTPSIHSAVSVYMVAAWKEAIANQCCYIVLAYIDLWCRSLFALKMCILHVMYVWVNLGVTYKCLIGCLG